MNVLKKHDPPKPQVIEFLAVMTKNISIPINQEKCSKYETFMCFYQSGLHFNNSLTVTSLFHNNKKNYLKAIIF